MEQKLNIDMILIKYLWYGQYLKQILLKINDNIFYYEP